ncbi:hypothetical protein HZB96_02475 [Candidatus Gottesmanbacteria bacterium]|nr:hypothetical protein [Candidatus Gottesmanbacteria bacterium]
MDRLLRLTVKIFAFLFPIFFLYITSESYEYNKMALLVITVVILLILFTLKIVHQRRFAAVTGTFSLSLFFLSSIAAVSTLFQSPNLSIALTTPLATTAIVSGFVLYLLLINILAGDARKENLTSFSPLLQGEGKGEVFMNILVFDAVFLCLYVIGMYTGILPKNSFTPAGSLLSTAMFLSVITIYLLSKVVINLLPLTTSNLKAGDERDKTPGRWPDFVGRSLDSVGRRPKDSFQVEESESTSVIPPSRSPFGHLEALAPSLSRGQDPQIKIIFYFLSLLLIGGTTIFLAIHLFTDQKPIILPLSFGWIIFLEILKNLKTMLLGVGPSNFLTAFSLGKPLLINQTPVWNIIFTSSSSFILNLATETGILAGIIYVGIILKLLKLLKNSPHYPFSIIHFPFILPLLFSLILQVFLPSSMSVFILTILLLAFVSEKKHLFSIDLAFFGKSVYFLLLPGIIITILITYFGGRAYFAEVIYKQSLDALVNNRGSDAYNLQIQALSLNPYIDRYHVVFSQTNLALANALAAQKSLTDEDKQRIPGLVQQAIDQARTAVTLYRTNVVNWDNLARIYASLTTYAKDADAWAETSYQQKIQLDPLNPNTRLSLGGFYLQMQKWDMAENLFRQAISLKPDFANAHFNLAVSYRQQKKFTEAYKELQSSMALVSPNSTDSAKIKEELDLLPPEAATESETPASTEVITPQTLETIESSPSSLKNPLQAKPTIPAPPITP